MTYTEEQRKQAMAEIVDRELKKGTFTVEQWRNDEIAQEMIIDLVKIELAERYGIGNLDMLKPDFK